MLLTNAKRSPHFDKLVSNHCPSPKSMERLPQLNYSLLKDNALRRKLSELGIPSMGPRPLLIRRHTEWINLVNSNCDSTTPRTKRELLHDLDTWDKTQGRQVLNSLSGGNGSANVMSKDFDGAAWATNHNQDFQSLIAKARRKTPRPAEDGPVDNKPSIDHQMPTKKLLAHETSDGPSPAPSPRGARALSDEQINGGQTSLIEIDTDD